MSATKGKRNPALLQPTKPQEAGSGRTWLVVGRRPIKHGERTYQPGETFPEDVCGRLESWLRTGMLVRMS